MKAKTVRKITDKMAFCAKAFNKLKIMPLAILIFKMKDKIVLKWIFKNYGDFIKNYKKNQAKPKVSFEKLPIWVCWFQGEENAPEIVKKCIQSIKKHSAGHEVIVLTDKNLSDYVDIPSRIIDKVKAGELSRTNFSDILRASLLQIYGGMWIDGTFFLTKDIPEDYFSYPIFSAAKQPEPKDRRNVCISRYRWTSSFIGAKNGGHTLFYFLKDILLEYEKTNSVFIDYLLIDYFIYIAYSNFDDVKYDIDNIPDNNIDFGWLFHVMNKPYDELQMGRMLDGDTFCFKLSYKPKWKKQTNGKPTFFKKFLEGNL